MCFAGCIRAKAIDHFIILYVCWAGFGLSGQLPSFTFWPVCAHMPADKREVCAGKFAANQLAQWHMASTPSCCQDQLHLQYLLRLGVQLCPVPYMFMLHSYRRSIYTFTTHVLMLLLLLLQDKITPASKGRQTALAILIAVSVLILLPMLPSGTEQAAVSPGTFL